MPSRRSISRTVEFVGSFPGPVPETGLREVAFAGRSNVGKSSMLNALLGTRKAARVSSTPGRTQAINLFRVGGALAIADLPGYGFARVPDAVREAWKPMIERYLGERDALQLVFLLVDARRTPQDMDLALYEALVEADIPARVVVTKVDKLKKHERKPAFAKLREAYGLPAGQPIPFSAKSNEVVKQLWAILNDVVS